MSIHQREVRLSLQPIWSQRAFCQLSSKCTTLTLSPPLTGYSSTKCFCIIRHRKKQSFLSVSILEGAFSCYLISQGLTTANESACLIWRIFCPSWSNPPIYPGLGPALRVACDTQRVDLCLLPVLNRGEFSDHGATSLHNLCIIRIWS